MSARNLSNLRSYLSCIAKQQGIVLSYYTSADNHEMWDVVSVDIDYIQNLIPWSQLHSCWSLEHAQVMILVQYFDIKQKQPAISIIR